MPGIQHGYEQTKSRVYGQQSQDLANRQAQEARDFGANLQGEQEKQFGFKRGEGLRNLAGQMRDVNRQASRRGLLYSGLQQAGKADAAQQTIGNLMQDRAGINLNTEQQLRDMEGGAMNTAFNDYQGRQQQEDDRYQKELAKHKSSKGFLGGLLDGVTGIFKGM